MNRSLNTARFASIEVHFKYKNHLPIEAYNGPVISVLAHRAKTDTFYGA